MRNYWGHFRWGFHLQTPSSVCHKASSRHGQFPFTAFQEKIGVVFPPSASRIQLHGNRIISLFGRQLVHLWMKMTEMWCQIIIVQSSNPTSRNNIVMRLIQTHIYRRTLTQTDTDTGIDLIARNVERKKEFIHRVRHSWYSRANGMHIETLCISSCPTKTPGVLILTALCWSDNIWLSSLNLS